MITPSLRPATLDDAALAADLMTAAYPAFQEDPVVTRYRWEHPRSGWSIGRFIAELDKHPIAYVDWIHGPREQDDQLHCELGVALDRVFLDIELLTYLWQWISDQAVAGGSRMLGAYAAEDEPEMLEALRRIGYERDRIAKAWELDLSAHGPRLLEEAKQARTTARDAGYELLTLADWQAPGKFEAMHALDTVTRR